jgi:hypothetical protein
MLLFVWHPLQRWMWLIDQIALNSWFFLVPRVHLLSTTFLDLLMQIFGGVGMACLPMSLIATFLRRPKTTISRAQYIKVAIEVPCWIYLSLFLSWLFLVDWFYFAPFCMVLVVIWHGCEG